ncbi:MAG: hypothetical protein RLN78_04200 [Phycisphaerales bacterium]
MPNDQQSNDSIEKTFALARFENANDNRKNEIELLWKRSAFYWGFIAIVFAGYGILLNTNAAFAIIVASFGVTSSACWYMANSAGAFWQKVWEQNIISDEIAILGKKVYTDIPNNDIMRKSVLMGSRRYSLSGVTIAFSNYVCAFWIMLCIPPVIEVLPLLPRLLPSVALMWLLISFIFILYVFYEARKHPSVPDEKPGATG